MFVGFESCLIDLEAAPIFARVAGQGPPLLLLHGFPETHLMWRDIAPILAQEFTVVCADLRGYGQSGTPASTTDHGPYTKRAMAEDMVNLMKRLGHDRFMVVGHDRGGRVAYRMALDCPSVVRKLAVLDVIPTAEAWDRADARFALSFWPWSLLAQPAPLPEDMIGAAADSVIQAALSGWGSPPSIFPQAVRANYAAMLKDREHLHAICEEYRAAATLDRDHDAADRSTARKIACPVLALWSGNGGLATWYLEEGGPLAIWRAWCEKVEGHAVAGGHFFPEEFPSQTAQELVAFLEV
ncbi:alpha/beta hydrolase [Bradyrhizobium sacchari]|uniref:Haloacetate dehalogenase n=1 Tax=Bradyrhizobium sacchari TaxID=1399419 RepID=A0A560JZ76_9BRAD|nr:alpha/beta hydrolase [Bradyrhizobium sacchari]OPY99422.1 alpha/beta hydrolase [Bradyrhizobium sacchari]TWB62733.1 haloacetate dehalogenase [Bradyrhizobium sacchari]TWB76337.1 haloacetate dehalogenase [Bradyrhizobium sacchari]